MATTEIFVTDGTDTYTLSISETEGGFFVRNAHNPSENSIHPFDLVGAFPEDSLEMVAQLWVDWMNETAEFHDHPEWVIMEDENA